MTFFGRKFVAGQWLKIQNMAIMPFGVIQGQQFLYQSKAHMRLPIGE